MKIKKKDPNTRNVLNASIGVPKNSLSSLSDDNLQMPTKLIKVQNTMSMKVSRMSL